MYFYRNEQQKSNFERSKLLDHLNQYFDKHYDHYNSEKKESIEIASIEKMINKLARISVVIEGSEKIFIKKRLKINKIIEAKAKAIGKHE